MKSILMRNISNRVNINILKDSIDFVRLLLLPSDPRTVICKAFRIEKLAATALGSIICSEGFAGHASSLSLPVFRLAKSLWNFLVESNQNYQQKDLLETFPTVY